MQLLTAWDTNPVFKGISSLMMSKVWKILKISKFFLAAVFENFADFFEENWSANLKL